MFKYKSLKRNSLLLILFTLSILYILIYLQPSVVDFDESYTMSLIKNSWGKMLYFDSIDVHPPLYYLLLKAFVSITSFWTNSIPIEIICARLFSLIVSIISFIFLYKITLIFNIKNNVGIEWISLLLLPNVLGFRFSTQQLIDIRMYSLAAMFIIITFYYLIKFYNSNNIKYLIILTISSICSMYTHYYAAMFSGAFILFYILFYLRNKQFKEAFQLFISILALIILFIPWIPIFLKQLTNSDTYWMSTKLELKETVEFIIIVLLFIYPIYKHYKNINSQLKVHLQGLVFVISVVFIFAIIYSAIRKPMFQYRYMFPVLLIYEYLSINIMISHMKYLNHMKYYSFIIIIPLFLNFIFSCIHQTLNIYPQSINDVKIYNTWGKSSTNHHIYLKETNNNNNDFNYIIYIPTFNKIFIGNKSFKCNSHIYNNKEYKTTFKNVINRIRYR